MQLKQTVLLPVSACEIAIMNQTLRVSLSSVKVFEQCIFWYVLNIFCKPLQINSGNVCPLSTASFKSGAAVVELAPKHIMESLTSKTLP